MRGRNVVAALVGAVLTLAACVSRDTAPDAATTAAATPTPAATEAASPAASPRPDEGAPDDPGEDDPVDEADTPDEDPGATAGFQADIAPIGPAVAERMRGVSWRTECPVALDDLAYLQVRHHGFDGAVHDGELVVAERVAEDVVRALEALFHAGFPLERMRLVDDYDADDDASMAANNSSAFNCRTVAGTERWSEHAYGTAIDINPVQNPWVRGDRVAPPAGRDHLDRSAGHPGMLVEGGPAVAAFDAIGWGWGGRWSGSRDYMHVSESGR